MLLNSDQDYILSIQYTEGLTKPNVIKAHLCKTVYLNERVQTDIVKRIGTCTLLCIYPQIISVQCRQCPSTQQLLIILNVY